jgi:hypothetical protein
MAMGDGTHELPVKADVREAIGKEEGDSVAVRLDEGFNELSTSTRLTGHRATQCSWPRFQL